MGKKENVSNDSKVIDHGGLDTFNFDNVDKLYLNHLRENVGNSIALGKRKYKDKFTWLITLNPFVDDFPKLQMIFEKILKKSYVSTCTYAFEQRGETAETISGFHVHGLFTFTKKKSKSKIIREFFSTSKSICKKESIDVKKIIDEENYQKVLEYIKGNKSSEKLLKARNDIIFRSKYGILPLYQYAKS